MGLNSCLLLLAFLLIHALLFSPSDRTAQAAAPVSGSSFSDPIPTHDFSGKLNVVSKRIRRRPTPPSPMIHAPIHFKSPPPSPRPPCRTPPPPPSPPRPPRRTSPPPSPPSSLWQPPPM